MPAPSASLRRPASARWSGLCAWLLVSYAAAAVGAIASADAGGFYASLTLPSWAPPAWLFGPVWTVLYTTMGVAAWLVWDGGDRPAARGALALFLVQLVPNALWSWHFFRWHQGAVSFAVIVILSVLILATLLAFRRVRPAAGWLLVPYFLWVGFAAGLNFALWRSNAATLG